MSECCSLKTRFYNLDLRSFLLCSYATSRKQKLELMVCNLWCPMGPQSSLDSNSDQEWNFGISRDFYPPIISAHLITLPSKYFQAVPTDESGLLTTM